MSPADPASVPPFTPRYAVAADGTRIAYDVAGAGTPLVVLPGQSNDHTWWDRTLPGFAARHAVVRIDPRGTGASDAPPGPYATREMAADVVAVLDDAGIDAAHVYGTSMGGRVAQWLAIDHPGRVRGLVLGCTSPGGAMGVERTDEVRASLNVRDHELVVDRLLDLMYTPGWRETHPGPYAVVGSPTLTPRSRRAHLAASDGHDAAGRLGEIAAPTLVLHGTDDLMCPAANVSTFVELIPGAWSHEFVGARHAYFDECEADATALVLGHLAAVDAG